MADQFKYNALRVMVGMLIPPETESEDSAVMYDQTESLWILFETSGCIIYYLLYKMFVSL